MCPDNIKLNCDKYFFSEINLLDKHNVDLSFKKFGSLLQKYEHRYEQL